MALRRSLKVTLGLAFAGLCLCPPGSPTLLGAGAIPDQPLIVTQVPRSKGPVSGEAREGGWNPRGWFAGARLVLVTASQEVRVLSEGFESACDANVSFDGQRLLFAGKKTGEARWRVWELGLDGQGLHALSPETTDAWSPIYVSTLFTLDSPEPWFTTVFVASEPTLNESGHQGASSLYNIKLDGTEPRRLTFTPNYNLDPFQMWDGRVIYAAQCYPQEPGAFPQPKPLTPALSPVPSGGEGERSRDGAAVLERQSHPAAGGRFGLFAIHVEGADMELYGGAGGASIQRMPCATEGGLVVFVEADQPAGDGGGQLACVEERRPHVTYRRLTRDPATVYLHPAPWRGNVVLVARRAAGADGQWGVVSMDLDRVQAETVFDTPEYDEVQAVVVGPRQRPDGHSTVVNPKFDTGVFYGLNCYTADAMREAHLPPGSIKRVRFIEGLLPSAASRASASGWPAVPRRLIGEAPVEADGSFNVEVPADTPLLLQTLDERGLALGTCGWIWVKPKETRGCIGCHEDPELIPENEYVQALRRPSNRLVLPLAQRRSVSFRAEVAPVLVRHCASAECHGGKDTPLPLPLSAPPPTSTGLEASYAALMAPADGKADRPAIGPRSGRYVDAGRARTSWLVWQLVGQDTSRPWDLNGPRAETVSRKVTPMPPPGQGTPLRAEDLRTLIQWIDLGAEFEPVAPEAPSPPAAGSVQATSASSSGAGGR